MPYVHAQNDNADACIGLTQHVTIVCNHKAINVQANKADTQEWVPVNFEKFRLTVTHSTVVKHKQLGQRWKTS